MTKSSVKFEKRANLLWSLKPILVCMQMCGIPALEPGSSTHWFLRLVCEFPILICLTLNSFFTIYNFLFEFKRELCPTGSHATALFKQLEYPTVFFNFFSMISNPAFVLGIPLIFVFQFYFTGKWRDILKSFYKIDQEILLDERFYRRCRNRCIFSIIVFLVILAGFVYPRLVTLTSIFNVGKIFDLKLKSVVCQKINVLILRNLTAMPPIYNNLSLGIGIWVTSSAFAVLTLFCVLVWMASLLADELNKRMKKTNSTALNEMDDYAFSLAMDRSLNEFDVFNRFVESINDYFGLATVISLFYVMIAFIVGINVLILLYLQTRNFNFTVLNSLIAILMGLVIITTLSRKLNYKAREFRNKLSRMHVLVSTASKFVVKRQIQMETVMLQVAAQPEIKIKAGFEMFDVNLPLLLTLFGIFVSYFLFIFTTMKANFGLKTFNFGPG